MLDIAARYDALTHNPARGTAKPPAAVADSKALAASAIAILRRRAANWVAYELPTEIAKRNARNDRGIGGARRDHALAPMIEVHFSTRMRTAESLVFYGRKYHLTAIAWPAGASEAGLIACGPAVDYPRGEGQMFWPEDSAG